MTSKGRPFNPVNVQEDSQIISEEELTAFQNCIVRRINASEHKESSAVTVWPVEPYIYVPSGRVSSAVGQKPRSIPRVTVLSTNVSWCSTQKQLLHLTYVATNNRISYLLLFINSAVLGHLPPTFHPNKILAAHLYGVLCTSLGTEAQVLLESLASTTPQLLILCAFGCQK